MRDQAQILHMDLDCFFAAVEQRDKPSLQGKPVIVGGIGGRGVVATASYEARAFGVKSAMSVAEARRRCPNAAYLAGRFPAYRAASIAVMAQLHTISGLVEHLGLDEAYADLSVPPMDPSPPARSHSSTTLDYQTRTPTPEESAVLLRQLIRSTTRLTASVGIGPSRSIAKLASEAAKPDGICVIRPDEVRAFLDPLPVTALSGVGPATAARLHNAGIRTVADLAAIDDTAAARLLGKAHGQSTVALARGIDHRPIVAARETKSISAEETFPRDLRDPEAMNTELIALTERVVRRLQDHGWAGRTVTLKVRFADFSTRTRSRTEREPLDDVTTITRVARRLLADISALEWSLAGGVRLLGVGISGLSDWVQPNLLVWPPESKPDQASGTAIAEQEKVGPAPSSTSLSASEMAVPRWVPGADVHHERYGLGWIWGSGLGRVTIRFEGPNTPPGPVRTFSADDPALTPAAPPLTGTTEFTE
ncbi:MAG: DNA polymerase IV [Actinomycetota bacterium]